MVAMDIYDILSESIMLLCMILFYHYIYMEPGFPGSGAYICFPEAIWR